MAEAGRGEFEQMLVHNLKTPLTGIMASLEMLHDGDFGALSPQQRAAIAVMQSQSNELLAMIDELLELGRMESPGVRVNARVVELPGLFEVVAAEWRPRLEGRLTTTVAPDVPAAFVDADVFRRVLGNLLMNAQVHGGTGVSVRLVAEAAGADAVRVLVADDGPGIAPIDAERVFGAFVRLNANRQGTSGLGLTWCRAAAAAMGGTIALIPSARGVTVQLEVPAALAAQAGPGARP